MDTHRFIVHVKTEDIYEDITEDAGIDRPLPKGKNKTVIGLIKYEFGGQILRKFVGLKKGKNI